MSIVYFSSLKGNNMLELLENITYVYFLKINKKLLFYIQE